MMGAVIRVKIADVPQNVLFRQYRIECYHHRHGRPDIGDHPLGLADGLVATGRAG